MTTTVDRPVRTPDDRVGRLTGTPAARLPYPVATRTTPVAGSSSPCSGIAQLMVVLDATIVNIALPTAQHALGLLRQRPAVDRHGLRAGLRQPAAARRPRRRHLRPQARLPDRPGRLRRRVGGRRRRRRRSACSSPPAPSRARSARCSPRPRCRCSTTTFTDPSERNKAFGIYGAIAGGGGAIGLLLGGVLTEYASWRWCLYVNLIFAVVAGDRRRDPAACTRRSAHRAKLDMPGAVTAPRSMFALVYGFTNAPTHGWSEPADLGLPGRWRGVLLAVFVWLADARSRTRCCRCGSCSTATAAARTWPCSSPAPACSACSCSSPTTCSRRWASPRSDRPRLPADDRRARDDRVDRDHGDRAAVRGQVAARARHGVWPRSPWRCSPSSALTSTYAAHVLPALLVMGLGLGLVFAAGDEHRHRRRRGRGRRRRLGDRQHDAAGRRLDRHRAAVARSPRARRPATCTATRPGTRSPCWRTRRWRATRPRSGGRPGSSCSARSCAARCCAAAGQ